MMNPTNPPFGPRQGNGLDVDEIYGNGQEQSVGMLFKELMADAQSLVREEIQLAKIEATRNATRAAKHAGTITIGGLIAYPGLVGLMIALGFLLGSFMPDWLGFVISAVVFLAVGGIMAMTGMNRLKNEDYSFELTSRTLQEDKQWMQREAQEVKEDPKRLGARR